MKFYILIYKVGIIKHVIQNSGRFKGHEENTAVHDANREVNSATLFIAWEERVKRQLCSSGRKPKFSQIFSPSIYLS